MKITNSMVKSYQRCKRQYAYKFEKNIVPRRPSLPLKRGSWLHELLQAQYEGNDWKDKNKELAKSFYGMFEEEREMYGDLPRICGHIMRSYNYHWAKEDEELDILEVEQEFEVELPHGHTLAGKYDAIVEDSWGMWLMEHKSHKKIPEDDYRFIDIQTARYVWALRKLGYPITGVLWNYICTVEPKTPQLLKDGTRLSKRKLRTDLFTFLAAIKEYGLDPRDYRDDIIRLKRHNSFFRRERVPKPDVVINTLIKEAVVTADEIERGFEPVRSIDRSCTYMCNYLSPCLTSLYGGDAKSIIQAQYQTATKDDYYGYEEVPNE